ncbi:MAG: hypothetical protein ACXU85_24025 [Xanthobacteraceae bacterium]
MTVADPSSETTDNAATEGDKVGTSDTSQPDASAASSTASTETAKAEPKGETKAEDAPKPKSVLEAAKAALAKDKGVAPSATDAKTDQQPKPETGKGGEQAKTEAEKAEEVPQQFKDHPAWQRIAKARDGFKAEAETHKAGAEKWKSFNELATAHMGSPEAAAQWLNRGGDLAKAGVTTQEQHVITEFALATKSDPNKAFAIIKPIFEALQNIVGEVLPNDLREAVDRGEMTEEAAQRLNKAEAAGRINQRRAEAAGKTVEDTRTAEAQRATNVAMGNAVASWEGRLAKSDPDWQRIAPLVNEQVGILREARQPKTPAEAVKLCDDAVALVKRMISTGAVARPAVGAPAIVPSNRQTEERPKSALEAARRALAR